MQTLLAMGAIFSIASAPLLFTLVFYLHNKHVAVLQERIHLLEERSPDKLASLLKSMKELYEQKLAEQEREHQAGIQEHKERAADQVRRLEHELSAVRKGMEIMEKYWSGDDYRYREKIEGS
jgi:biopolymer transport protein ExbB/TolQ